MNLLDFPGCCTADILTGFGQTGTAEYEYRPDTLLTHHKVASGVLAKMRYSRKCGHATIVVTLNSQQKTALEVLRALNWHVSEPLGKRNHSETDLHVCYCALAPLADVEYDESLVKIVEGFA